MTSIYGLYDPRVNSIRYVGKTSMKIGKRLSCHISAAKAIKDLKKASMVNCWMHKLLKEGVRPQIRLLEVCDETIED